MKKKMLIFLSLLFFAPFIVKAYEGKLDREKSWGGSGTDIFNSATLVEDGGFVVVGDTNSKDIEGLTDNASASAIIVKYDKEWNMIWQKRYGGNNFEMFNSVISLEDGGIVAVGNTSSTDIGLPNKGSTDAIIVKYDRDGNMLWQKNWGGSQDECFYSAALTEDGGFIVGGDTTSSDIEGLTLKGRTDVIIIKYDKSGNLVWQKNWGGNDDDFFNSAALTEDGGFIVAGCTDSTDIENLTNVEPGLAIVKYDKDGNMLWQKFWGENLITNVTSIAITETGEFVVVGFNGFLSEGQPKCFPKIVKFDKNGNMIWYLNYPSNNPQTFECILLVENDSYLVFGTNDKFDGMIYKYSNKYNLENITTGNGASTIEQKGKYGIITSTPNEGFEVDKIIVKDKDGNILDVEVSKLEDGTYSFPLYTDVSVEVLFKEILSNPKTGVSSFIGVMFTLMLIGISGFFMIRNCNNSYEL